MTNKTLEQKALVIDDEVDVALNFIFYGGDKFDYVEPFTLEAIEEKLRSREYTAILLDGKMKLNLEGKSDGDTIAKRIRKGAYGETNRNTPLYGISMSSGMFSGDTDVRSLGGKPYSEEDFKEGGKYSELMGLLCRRKGEK